MMKTFPVGRLVPAICIERLQAGAMEAVPVTSNVMPMSEFHRSRRLPAGMHETIFDGSTFSSGAYIYRLTTGTASVSRTMQLIT